MNNSPQAPWLANYGKVPYHLNYPQHSMVEEIAYTAARYPEHTAYEFMGRSITYEHFMKQIHRTARAYYALGIRPQDRVTISMPNTPQGIVSFYALNMIGAVPNMIHPLSSEGEILFFLETSHSCAALTLDQFYPKFAGLKDKYALKHLIIANIADELSPIKKLGYKLTAGKNIDPVKSEGNVICWKDFLTQGDSCLDNYEYYAKPTDLAAILYSGGTSGTTKGIMLSNLNFNALAYQTIAMDTNFTVGDKMLAVMPMFHGFGLGVCIHTFLAAGGCCLLIPRFNAQTYAKLIKRNRPNYIAGVPTLYESLLRNPDMNDVDLSCLKGVFSGGDSLSIELKKKFDRFLKDHQAPVKVREGYGTTECVTASCLTPYHMSREGSIGFPYPDTYYKIVRPGTTDEAAYGEEGEICLSGPSVMLGYLDNPEETATTLQQHTDGRTWLHTGDLGVMDKEGFIYFRQRIKRMIVSSGYSIYPSQLENVIDAHPAVQMSCVIGVPDPIKVQKVKAFIMPKPGIAPTQKLKDELFAYCRSNIAKYSMPYDIEFRTELPKTLVGKVAYKVLEAEEEALRKAADAPTNLDPNLNQTSEELEQAHASATI